MSDEAYFRSLESGLAEAREVAERARSQGRDPEPEIEIPQARDMADRVEKVLGIDGVAERIRELEGEFSREEAALALVEDFVEGSVGDYETDAAKIEGAVRTAVALLTEGVVAAPIEGIDLVEVLDNDDGTQFVNVYYAGPIRSAGGTAQALSVLVADYARSLLGFAEYDARTEEVDRYAEEVTLYDNETGLQYSPSDEETKFIARHMPIMLDGEATSDGEVSGTRDIERVETNGARGGMCLVLAEGIALKAPKIQRYTRELDEVDWPWLQDLIDGTITDDGDGATDAEDGDGAESEEEEAGGSGDDTGEEDEDGNGDDAQRGPPRAEPHKKFLRDLIAGRPVFSHPSEAGGFRLRYGRARNHGFATAGVHPATMHVVDDFLATGTQIKTERPGKAAGVVPVDTIEGPTVRLANGEVRRIDDPEEARALRNGVEAILDLGEYLVNYGEFVENNHDLAPASYTVEWWIQEFERTAANVRAMRDSPRVDLADPDPAEAIEWAREYDAPLHPKFTYLWHDVDVADFERLAAVVAAGRTRHDGALVLADDADTRRTLERLLVEHVQGVDPDEALPEGGSIPAPPDAGSPAEGAGRRDRRDPADGRASGDRGDLGRNGDAADAADPGVNGDATDAADPGGNGVGDGASSPGENGAGAAGEGDRTAIVVPTWRPLALSLGLDPDHGLERTWESIPETAREWPDAVEAVDAVAPFTVRERAPTRVGNRMGRPEKSEKRELSPAVHALFPIGDAGGDQRDVAAAADHQAHRGATPGQVEVDVGRRRCRDCAGETFTGECPDCGGHTDPVYTCPDCGQEIDPDDAGRVHCSRCDEEATAVETRVLDVRGEYRDALDSVGERENAYDILKGVKGLTSTVKTPEPLAKGVLRAKHGVSAFKDGTVRYDMTDLPVTAVRPEELDVTVEQFRGLGYETDVHGDPLRHDDQLVELEIQDVVLSDGAAEYMLDTADFVDDLLESYYGLDPFYDLEDRDDLVGELVFGMAPHTSAAVVARVVGFTSAAVGYAHPYFHAAKRRNCFHPDTKVWFEDEDGRLRHERIERLVEDRLENPRVDDFGTLIEELDGSVHVPSVDGSGRQVLKPVSAISKHPAQDHVVEVRTGSGRELVVTPDHDLMVYDTRSGDVVEREAHELTENDYLLTPKHLESVEPSSEPTEFDLLAEFVRTDEIENERLMIKGLDKDELYTLFERALAGDWEGKFYPLKSTADYLDMNHKTLSNYLYRESFPVQILLDLFDSLQEMLAFVPDDVTLGMKRDGNEMDRFVEIDERVATLLGYYAAEGFTRAQETPKGTIHRTTVSGTESEAREFFLDVLASEFGVDPYEENNAKVTVSGRLLRVFVDTVLDAGRVAHTKRVPQCIFDAPDRVVGAYLGGYFSGDGTVDGSGLRVSATTVSDELKEDLTALLTRFGIKTNVRAKDPVPLHGQFPDHYEEGSGEMSAQAHVLSVTSEDAVHLGEAVGIHLSRKRRRLERQVSETTVKTPRRAFDGGAEDTLVDPVASVEYRAAESDHVYSLTVADTHSLVVNDLAQKQCDGDEDCVMLLMDGLLNFSRQYLPDQRGGQMDAPLVMSSRIDPTEIDDEAHNMDVVAEYPLEFYEATRELAHPEEVDVEIAEDRLGTDRETEGFAHTHDTTNIAAGPDLSAYKTLGDMEEKMDGQLELARTIRAVDETDVAERIIEYHFLPDLLGNLRAFSRQEVRCLDCSTKFRRPPLTGECRECGGDVTLTVHEGSVTKYLQTATRIAEEYGAREYTKQRLEVLERSIDSIFENDKNKQSGIADFM